MVAAGTAASAVASRAAVVLVAVVVTRGGGCCCAAARRDLGGERRWRNGGGGGVDGVGGRAGRRWPGQAHDARGCQYVRGQGSVRFEGECGHLLGLPARREEVVDAGPEGPGTREDLRLHQPRLGRVAHCAGAFLCLFSLSAGCSIVRETPPQECLRRACGASTHAAAGWNGVKGTGSSASGRLRASP